MNISDLYPGVEKWEIPDKYYQNLVSLLPKIMALEEAFGSLLKISSGFRTWKHHLEIYTAINDARKAAGKDPLPVPLKSTHLTGSAVDIADPNKTLQTYLADEIFLTDNGLWSEGFKWTNGWCHLQDIPYGSWKMGGSRFYKPF